MLSNLLTPADPVPAARLGRVHFAGIGGAGMSGIARIMLARGIGVSGSDARDSALLGELRELGATVHVGHEPGHLGHLLRGRALTFVMSATYVLVGIGEGLGGLFVHSAGPRWIWAGAGASLLVAALAGSLLARRIGGETASPAEASSAERSPVAATN